MDPILIIPVAVLVLLIGFFAGIRAAYVSAGKLSVELRKKQGAYSGKVWARFMEKPASFMSTYILIYIFLLVLYSLVWNEVLQTVWLYWRWENLYIELALTILAAAISLIFIEYILKSLFKAKAIAITGSSVIAFLTDRLFGLFGWLARYILAAAEWMIKYLFNVKVPNKEADFGRVDLDRYILQLKRADVEESNRINRDIFQNVLALSEKRVRECMIPRKEVVAVEENTPIVDIQQKFIETKLSRLIVYKKHVDHILGYVHHLDLFQGVESLDQVLHTIPLIPMSMKATDLIEKFTHEKKSIAWVIDEFGGTAGIVTMEDVLEEIFGEIYDEYDVKEELTHKQLTANEFIFSGRLELVFLKNNYHLIFRKEEEAETLSGYIINQYESIPRERDRIIIDNYQFDILAVTETRIELVKLKILR